LEAKIIFSIQVLGMLKNVLLKNELDVVVLVYILAIDKSAIVLDTDSTANSVVLLVVGHLSQKLLLVIIINISRKYVSAFLDSCSFLSLMSFLFFLWLQF
jgi:hypothetical protein